jgi:hypothetical protein
VDGIVRRAKYIFRVNILNGQNGFSHESDVRIDTSGRIPLNNIGQIREVICRTRTILSEGTYGGGPVTINTAAVSFGKTQIEQGQLAVQIDDCHSTPTVDFVKYE